MFQPKRTLDSRGSQPSVVPILLDGVLATAAFALAVSAENDSCPRTALVCFSNLDQAAAGVMIGLGTVYAFSALYGYSRYTGPADLHTNDLADEASIAAHSGDCTTATRAADQLHAGDQNAYEALLTDDAVQRCLLQASDAERRAVLDTIAHSRNVIPLAGVRSP
jgi:hypothetical protein